MGNNKIKVIRSSDVEPYSPKEMNDVFFSRMLINKESVCSQKLIINEFTLKAGKKSYKGVHPYPYDEVYYVLKGTGILILGDEIEERYEIEPHIIAFISNGVPHSLENNGTEDLVLLTIMPEQPVKGANLLYDSRINEWGTSFKFIDNPKGVKCTFSKTSKT